MDDMVELSQIGEVLRDQICIEKVAVSIKNDGGIVSLTAHPKDGDVCWTLVEAECVCAILAKEALVNSNTNRKMQGIISDEHYVLERDRITRAGKVVELAYAKKVKESR